MNIYISIISHGHENILKKTSLIKNISKNNIVIIKNNKESSKGKLQEIFKSKNIHIIDKDYNLGFGHNNNYIYDYCLKNFEMKDNDFFCVINPDIVINGDILHSITNNMKIHNLELSTIPLYLDNEYQNRDNSIRKFPTLSTFILSFLGFNKHLPIMTHEKYMNADWAAGSFLIFKSSLYKKLNGFDKKYFMYCEDIDICYRAKKYHSGLVVFPEWKGIHLAQRDNRKIFSKHFIWHIKSIFTYLKSR
ncbi:glycosyltransferase family 2 protein [Xenorhabdus bovienii]|uniref:glycosyltransferase family 2 protein n=1 Tax=Xenorhabdus bovienii TaxID=40576 RepID=UPI0023B25868|nr:glycosyltransferase family 2 protein [Xenorhabdus bovienii]MDE9481664.1 glycosyltransferase family 2 protein [Xenorhabdus bovienii]MDE9486660.1 glycosyltransferase family 2 protein [Xenorhabdus bovienii]